MVVVALADLALHSLMLPRSRQYLVKVGVGYLEVLALGHVEEA